MSAIKKVIIANGTNGEDSFRSTIRRHHQRISRQNRRNDTNSINAHTTMQDKRGHLYCDMKKMPLLLRSHSLPTVNVGKDNAKWKISRIDRTKTLANRIRTLGKCNTLVNPNSKDIRNIEDNLVKRRAPLVKPATFKEVYNSLPSSYTSKHKRRHGTRRRRRSIQITMPSKKTQAHRMNGGLKVHAALQKLDKHNLLTVLAKNKLVKQHSRAPESLLRNIAAGAF